MTRFDELADDEWRALLPELHGLAVEEAVKMIPSDEALMAGIVEYCESRGGKWIAADRLVGARLSDAAGMTICEIPPHAAGWALLRRLEAAGRIEGRARQRGTHKYRVFRVAR